MSSAGVAGDDTRFARLAGDALVRCDVLARCSDEPGRIARVFCSPPMRDAHRLVSAWMHDAGMAPRVDAAGNLLGAYYPPGCDSQRRLLIGSHLDTVIDAGRYDGILGVMLGIATVAALRDAQSPLPWALEVVGFSDEEGARFGAPFLGSLALAGKLSEELLARRDADGVTVAEALAAFGVDPTAISECAVKPGEVVAYIEPHIEQGPVLAAEGAPLGVVSAIAGQTRLTIEWAGQGGHAGTAPMARRCDPLPAACRWIAAVEAVGRDTPGLVATVGRVEVEPNVSNCIPRRVQTSLDVRHRDDEVRRDAVSLLAAKADVCGQEVGVSVSIQFVHAHAAIAMDAGLTQQLAESVGSLQAKPRQLVSGAGHDAGVMAAVVPTAMLFLRSPGGVSHDPAECVLESDVTAALRALVKFIEQLAAEQSP